MFKTILNISKTELRTTAKACGIKNVAKLNRGDLFEKLGSFLETCSSEAFHAVAHLDGIRVMLPHTYRGVRADSVVEGMPIHNGYCTDSIQTISKEKPADHHMYHGDWSAPIFIIHGLHNTRRRYQPGNILRVNMRWLTQHDPIWMTASK